MELYGRIAPENTCVTRLSPNLRTIVRGSAYRTTCSPATLLVHGRLFRIETVSSTGGIGVNVTATALAHELGHMSIARVFLRCNYKSCVIGGSYPQLLSIRTCKSARGQVRLNEDGHRQVSYMGQSTRWTDSFGC